jgi:hypothetical protein
VPDGTCGPRVSRRPMSAARVPAGTGLGNPPADRRQSAVHGEHGRRP